MERVASLIHKLAELQKNGAPSDQLLVTAQLIVQELTARSNTSTLLGTTRVAVVLPGPTIKNILPADQEKEVYQLDLKEEDLEEDLVEDSIEEKMEATPEPPPRIPPSPAYSIKKPSEIEERFAPKPVDQTLVKEAEETNFPAIEETPTFFHHQPKELHEVIGENKESLNDKLKQDQKELGHAFKGAPIKDLRKAIGVNDKFVFLNDLFRGDETMYERSIKTINNFHILPEAEYWINRELKVKLGWNDTHETVQHFYQLVRRRFS